MVMPDPVLRLAHHPPAVYAHGPDRGHGDKVVEGWKYLFVQLYVMLLVVPETVLFFPIILILFNEVF